MHSMNTPLADKPSDLILQAIEDLEKTEASSEYCVDMQSWHLPISAREDKTQPISEVGCHVCLAGSVIAQRSNVMPSEYANPDHFSLDIRDKLRSLDYFRQGKIEEALGAFYQDRVRLWSHYDGPTICWIPAYDPSPSGFKAELRHLAAILKRFHL